MSACVLDRSLSNSRLFVVHGPSSLAALPLSRRFKGFLIFYSPGAQEHARPFRFDAAPAVGLLPASFSGLQMQLQEIVAPRARLGSCCVAPLNSPFCAARCSPRFSASAPYPLWREPICTIVNNCSSQARHCPSLPRYPSQISVANKRSQSTWRSCRRPLARPSTLYLCDVLFDKF